MLFPMYEYVKSYLSPKFPAANFLIIHSLLHTNPSRVIDRQEGGQREGGGGGAGEGSISRADNKFVLDLR